MRRSNVNYFGRVLFRRSRDRDSFTANRSWHDGRPGKAKGSASLIQSRILDPCYLAPIYDGHCAHHHSLLRPSADEELLWMTSLASVSPQVRSDSRSLVW